MNNRFKFRIWDKTENDFYLDTYVLRTDGILFGDNYGLYEVNQNDFVIQQFSGLKDKRDKEIFEGDIIKYGKLNYEVIWNEYEYRWMAVCPNYSKFHWPKIIPVEFKCGEVIGNIYQNPELLK